MHDEQPELLMAFKPASERECPKCGGDDLTLHYVEHSNHGDEFDEEEHVSIHCNDCDYAFRMSPKDASNAR